MKFSKRFKRHSKWLIRSVSKHDQSKWSNYSIEMIIHLPDIVIDIISVYGSNKCDDDD